MNLRNINICYKTIMMVGLALSISALEGSEGPQDTFHVMVDMGSLTQDPKASYERFTFTYPKNEEISVKRLKEIIEDNFKGKSRSGTTLQVSAQGKKVLWDISLLNKVSLRGSSISPVIYWVEWVAQTSSAQERVGNEFLRFLLEFRGSINSSPTEMRSSINNKTKLFMGIQVSYPLDEPLKVAELKNTIATRWSMWAPPGATTIRVFEYQKELADAEEIDKNKIRIYQDNQVVNQETPYFLEWE